MNIQKARNEVIYGGYYVEVTGGAARADLSNDGWYGTVVGRTQSATTIFVTATGGPGTWVGWANLHAPNARNIGYWTTSFNTGALSFPTSGKVDH